MQKEKVETPTQGNGFIYYLGAAVLCGGAIWGLKGYQAAEEYFAGYLLEQSLSVDNLFVFMLCFSFFKTPVELQDRVLSIGVWSAAILRLVMILAGVQLVENFKPLLLVFAAILLYSSFGLLFGEDDDEEEDLSQNPIVKTINKVRNQHHTSCSGCRTSFPRPYTMRSSFVNVNSPFLCRFSQSLLTTVGTSSLSRKTISGKSLHCLLCLQ